MKGLMNPSFSIEVEAMFSEKSIILLSYIYLIGNESKVLFQSTSPEKISLFTLVMHGITPVVVA
jgi:hypothetical protein